MCELIFFRCHAVFKERIDQLVPEMFPHTLELVIYEHESDNDWEIVALRDGKRVYGVKAITLQKVWEGEHPLRVDGMIKDAASRVINA